jgi:endonuclease/exonuclease/phosphatase family metal-dependent hydrolase
LEPAALRVMTYNVRYFSHALRGLASTRAPMRRIARAIAALADVPDIICLQEVETVSLRSGVAHRRRPKAQTQLEGFMAELEQAFASAGRPFPYQAFYFRAHAYQLRKVPLYTTGLAVLVNGASLRVDGHNAQAPARITHHHVARWKDTKQTRICAHVRLTSPSGRALHVFNTHLSLPTPFAREFWTARQKMGFGRNQLQEARTLATFIRQHAADDPFIVCGDFNSPPASPVWSYLVEESALVSAQLALGQIDGRGPRAFPTAGLMRLRMHLDHLFSGGSVVWLDLEDTAPFGDRIGAFHALSDHVPLIGRFAID